MTDLARLDRALLLAMQRGQTVELVPTFSGDQVLVVLKEAGRGRGVEPSDTQSSLDWLAEAIERVVESLDPEEHPLRMLTPEYSLAAASRLGDQSYETVYPGYRHFRDTLGISSSSLMVNARGVWARRGLDGKRRPRLNRWVAWVGCRDVEKGDCYPAVWVWNTTIANGYRFDPVDRWSSCASQVPRVMRPVAERMHSRLTERLAGLCAITLQQDGWDMLEAAGRPKLGDSAGIKSKDGRDIPGIVVAFNKDERRLLVKVEP